MIAKSKNKRNLIKILCVLLGAVFAFTTSIVYGAFSWQRSHNSGYSTGSFLPNQSYQIINDSLPNGIPYGDGTKEYEIALQYSYDYAFDFYLEYTMSWSGSGDTSNVILNYANRDAWFVDNSRMYYRDTVSAGSGKLPIIVGVNFTNTNDATYYGQTLTINITKVNITKTNSVIDTTGVAGTAWSEYRTRSAASYTGTDAYVLAYNQTAIGSYKPTAPTGETAYKTGTITEISSNTSLIPTGYTELKYIESTGTQYIDTGVVPTNTLDIEVKFLAQAATVGTIFGAVQTAGTAEYQLNQAGHVIYVGSKIYYNVFKSDTLQRTVLKGTNFSVYDEAGLTNSITVERVGADEISLNVYLMAGNRNGTAGEYSNTKMYSCKMWQDNELIRNFVPVQNADGAIGMYDTVEGKFYANAGTGEFAYAGMTSENSHKQIFGNKNYLGLGAQVITGSSSINLKATITGGWSTTSETKPGDVHIVSNTIKYNFADHWGEETYDSSTEVYETRTFEYAIPAHTSTYVDIAETVEMITRGFFSNSDYSGFYIVTAVQINGVDFKFDTTSTPGISTGTISTVTATTTAMPTSDVSVVNSSKYEAALYSCDATGDQTQTTQIKVINNTASTLSISASYQLKIYISNGNSAAEYGRTYDFADATHWARGVETSSEVTISQGVTSTVLAPYSAKTICTSFVIKPGAYSGLAEQYRNAKCDVWIELVPTITATTTTEKSSQLVLDAEVSGTSAKLYATNLSDQTMSAVSLSGSYLSFNDQTGMTAYANNGSTTEPANWAKNYWKYYVSVDGKYVKNTNSTWNPSATYYAFAGWQTGTIASYSKDITIAPGEKVYLTTITVTSANNYNFSNYTLTGTVASTTVDVLLANENTGKAYLINNSATVSYYVRFSGTVSADYLYNEGGNTYFVGLIRPGQVIPVDMTAIDTQCTVETIADTTGSLPASVWTTGFLSKLKAMYN